MPTVDSLDIQISTSVNKANASLTTLISRLDKVSASLSGINSRGLATMGAGINKLANAMGNFASNTKTADFARLSKNLTAISNVDTSKFSEIASKMSVLSRSFSGFGSVDVSGITNVAGALSKLGSNGAVAGADNLLKMKNSLEQFVSGMNSVGSLTFDASSLSNLISSISRLGGKTATEAAKNLLPISANLLNFVRQLNNVGSLNFDTESLSNLISGISRLGGKSATQATENLPQISRDLQKFIAGLNEVGSISFDSSGMGELISGISRLGGKAATQAVTNMPALASSLKNLMQTLSTAPKVSQNLIDMTNALAKLSRTGSSSGKAADSLSRSFTKLSSVSNKTTGALKGMQNNFKNLLRSILPILGIRQLFNWGKQAMEISSDLTEVQNVVDVTFGNMVYKVEEFAKTSIEQFGMSELALKQYSSRFQAMGAAMGIDSSVIANANKNLSALTNGYISASDSMSDVSLNLTKLTADMASFYNVEQDVVAEDLAAIFTGQTRPLRSYGLDLTQATLQEWALKQGIDADIQSMSQAEKTMLRYQYVLANTTAAQGDFARTANTWANQVRILKQNFEQLASIIGGSLINAFKPLVKALNSAMSQFIAFAETISNSLGKIFGWTFEKSGGGITQDFEGAADASDDIADSTGAAAKNIKKMQAGLRAFDELDVINMPDNAGGTGGAGAGAGAAGNGISALGGTWIDGEGLLDKFESELDTLYKLGEYIGNTLSKAMEGINWDSVYNKAKNFGKGLANFLNGLISPRLFGNAGRTLANSLNTAFHFLDSFGETFDWKNFGNSLANGLHEFIKNWDAGLTASVFSRFIMGIAQTITSAAKTLMNKKTFKVLGQKLVDFICGIDWAGLSWDLKNLWEALMDAAVEFPSDFGKGIAEGIMSKITGAKISNVKIPDWAEKLGDVIKNFMFSITNPFKQVQPIMDAIFPQLKKARNLVETISGIGSAASKAGEVGQKAFESFGSSIEKTTHLSDKTIETLDEITNKYAYIEDVAGKYVDLVGRNASLNEEERRLLETYTETLKDNVQGFEEAIDPVSGLFTGTKDELDKLIESTKNYYIVLAAKDALVDYGKELFGLKREAGNLVKELNEKLTTALGSNGKTAIEWMEEIGRGNDNQLKTLLKRLQDANFDTSKLTDSEKELYDKTLKNNKEFSGYIKLLGDVPEKMAENQAAIRDNEEAMADLTEIVKTGGESWPDTAETAVKANLDIQDSTIETSQVVSDKIDEAAEKAKRGLEKFRDSASDSMSKIAAAAAIAGIDVKNGFVKNAEGLEGETKKVFIDTRLKVEEESEKMGENGGKLLKTNFRNSTASFSTIGLDAMDKLGNAINSSAVGMGISAGAKIGLNIGDGISSSILEKKNKILNAMGDIWKDVKFKFAIEGVASGAAIGMSLIPQYAVGGFPEDGLFMANHGELVGQFANGRTAVVNNKQITQGFADTIYPAIYNAVSSAIRNSAGGISDGQEINVYIGNDKLTDYVVDGINEKTRRIGKTPIKLV